MNWKWKCNNCGGDEIEKILFNCIVSSAIVGIYEKGKTIEYGPSIVDDFSETRFACKKCKIFLRDTHFSPIINEEEFLEYMKGFENEKN